MGRIWWNGPANRVTTSIPTEALLRFCVTWNTNSRHCHEAQAVLGVLLRHETPEELLAYEGVRGTLEALLPYTGMRHGPGSREAPGGFTDMSVSPQPQPPLSSSRAALSAA